MWGNLLLVYLYTAFGSHVGVGARFSVFLLYLLGFVCSSYAHVFDACCVLHVGILRVWGTPSKGVLAGLY